MTGPRPADGSRGRRAPAARLSALGDRALGRWRDAAWRIGLAAVTAAVAWELARFLLGQQAPVFAPIAAVVCLTDAAGVRGQRAARLLAGVCVGVLVGEAARTVLGPGWLQVGAAVAAGMLVVAVGSINSLTLLQAGIASLLVVGLSSPQAGWTRLASALVGGVLALLVSQVLASPSPVRLLAGAASTALRPVADGLDAVTAALRDRSPAQAAQAAEDLRRGHEGLAAFLDTRSTVDRLAARSLRGRRERARVRALQERFAGLEYVYSGSVLLARTAAEVVGREDADRVVTPEVVGALGDLAAAVRAVADEPTTGDPPTGDDHGRRRAHEVAVALAAMDPDEHLSGTARLATQVHLVAVDVDRLTSAGGPAAGLAPRSA